MIIDESFLLMYGAECIEVEAGDIIFQEGSLPKFYYQIIEGTVELNNYNEDGKEFTHNILSIGQCFGESLLFNDKVYPMTAIAKTACKIFKLSKNAFFDLLSEKPHISFDMFKCLADRLYYKYIMLFNISLSSPSDRIKTFIDYFKEYNFDSDQKSYMPLTRQQLANLTGLRVETVIRAIKKMEKDNLIKIENRKIRYSE